MILAVDNKLCYYNNHKEKSELLEMFGDVSYKVFCNSDIKNAQNYAKTKKISGFITNEMDIFDVLLELKNEGVNLISFETKSGEKKIVILNNLYILNTKKYIIFNSSYVRIYKKVHQSKDPKNVIKNMNKQITNYALYHKIPLDKAAFHYFFNFERNYKKYPWGIVKDWSFSYSKETKTISFNQIADTINIKDVSSCDYKICFDNYKLNYSIKENDIISIKEEKLDLAFINPYIIEAIEQNFKEGGKL